MCWATEEAWIPTMRPFHCAFLTVLFISQANVAKLTKEVQVDGARTVKSSLGRGRGIPQVSVQGSASTPSPTQLLPWHRPCPARRVGVQC